MEQPEKQGPGVSVETGVLHAVIGSVEHRKLTVTFY